MSRVKKKRTLEKGHKLTQLRMWRKWAGLMAIDRTKAVTPLAVAISHYNDVLLKKIVFVWKAAVLERGIHLPTAIYSSSHYYYYYYYYQ